MIKEQYWVRPKEWPTFGIGHNGGPPLDDDEPPGKLLYVRYAWKQAHAEAWKTPPRDIVLFRLRRAAEAGLTYEEYTSRLLDTGRYPQAGDKPRERKDNAK